MTHRLTWRMLLVICVLYGVVAPTVAVAAREIQPEVVPVVTPSPPGTKASDSSTATVPPANEESGFVQNSGAPVPGQQSLVALIGKSEITVLENVDWQFVKSMDETQVFGEEFASQAGETDLSGSIRAGRSFSRESLAATARTEQAKARTGQALGLLLPSVIVRANYGTETSEPSVALDKEGNPIPKDSHDRTDVAWTVRQPLFDLPSYFDWRRRQVIEQVSHESYRSSDGDAYIATVGAYLTLVSTRLHTDLTRDFEKQLADLLSYIEKRAKGGAASVSDMARVRARSQETLSFRLEQEAAHEAAGIDFVRLTNLVPSRVRLPEFADIGADNLPRTFSAAVATAMQRNPEVGGLAAEIRAAEIDKKVAKSQFLPRLDAEYTDTYSQHAGGDEDADGQRDKRGMLVLSWSPLNGGRDYEYYQERTARHKELQYRFDDERRRVVQGLSANYSTLAITEERIKSGYKELTSISMAVEAMSKRMLSGNQSLLDLLDVYDRFYQARSRLVDLHILEIYTMAQLVRLMTGTPWTAPAEILPVTQTESLPVPAAVSASGKSVEVAAVNEPTPGGTGELRESANALPTAQDVASARPVEIPVAAPADLERSDVESVATSQNVPVKSLAPIEAAAAVGEPETSVDNSRPADDAYAPLWLDIIPQNGTGLAGKNSEETAGSGLITLGLLDSGDRAKIDQYALEVEGKLGQPIKVQLFASEDALAKWFRGLRVVDLAVIPVDERGDLLAGDYALLQAMPRPASSTRQEILVARRDLSEAQLLRLAQLFGAAH